ncbi:hypothetical protein EVAR_66634_1, partial [Eumeta japonica]
MFASNSIKALAVRAFRPKPASVGRFPAQCGAHPSLGHARLCIFQVPVLFVIKTPTVLTTFRQLIEISE